MSEEKKLTESEWRALSTRAHCENEQFVKDISIEWLYKPHSLTLLVCLLGVLVYWAFNTEPKDMENNTKAGLFVMMFFIIGFGLMVFPSGPFIRPHPSVWRIAFGIGFCYELWLLFLVFQAKPDARSLMKYLDPKLGVKLPERSYAEHCEITFENIAGNLDRFAVAHFVGWFFKALLVRDNILCWVMSLSWEIIEMLLTHMLPNFAECWWDQWILDVLLTNGVGIYLGIKLCEYLEIKEYRWSSFRDLPTVRSRAHRAIMQFTPESWTRVRWESSKSLKRLFSLHLLFWTVQAQELNAFFLKQLLWIPPSSNLNVYRILIWYVIGLPGLRQAFFYITDEKVKRIGMHAWLGIFVMSTELLLIVKLGWVSPPLEFTKPMPPNVRTLGVVSLALYVVAILWGCLSVHRAHTRATSESGTGTGTITPEQSPTRPENPDHRHTD